MYKSALIFGGVMLVAALVTTLVLPYCVPCLGLLLGLAAGYVAGVFGKWGDQATSTKSGAIAGALAGIGAILGEMIGSVINGFAVGPDKTLELMRSFGLQGTTMTTGQYWATQLGANCCISVVAVALMAGLGAVGGIIWWKTANKPAVPPAMPLS